MKQPSKQELEAAKSDMEDEKVNLLDFWSKHWPIMEYALQLAIDLQPRPISELGDIIKSKYKIIPAGNGTHFHDLSALPKPEVE